MSLPKILSIVGTRPEVIKMAPVILELEQRPSEFDHVLVTTSQHREMLFSALDMFGLKPDINLDLMQENQTLGSFAARSLASLSDLFAELKPHTILVQGDTTTVMTAALAAFYLGVRVGHVEAGLRSFLRRNPFPEEINRRIAGCVADLHFAPTERARDNLLREGVAAEDVFVTGNTIVDALQSILPVDVFDEERLGGIDYDGRRVLLVTAHRRENHGPNLKSICSALKTLVATFDDVEIVFPVHLNPNVREMVYEELGQTPRIQLTAPVSYRDLLGVMRRCYLILTDSGGIQEEAVSFHKPVLVLREVTERPEVIECGAGKVIGLKTQDIIDETSDLLTNQERYLQMSTAINPFGDGRAAERIVNILARQAGVKGKG
ncbi:MAG TPA: UDP-N-acetylglucosamine 2-epimerase (non-hydrolyzing) [Pyrinomonadaceae bacterium]|nr:UDP-N-acetylglucosamine 2-epimerase (non-hydrolyzing) [Pyrinomonadaceae bacterium]